MARDRRSSHLRAITAYVLAVLALLAIVTSGTGQAAPATTEGMPAMAVARSSVRGAMGVLVSHLPRDAKSRLVGIYAAFDDSATDIGSMAACDDDGDYVVVVSDALLRLARAVAEARATDESFGTHKQGDYAAWLTSVPPAVGASQGLEVRPLPPPPGFFEPTQARSPAKLALEAVRFREMVAWIVASELGHLVDGSLVCPNPTATHERGDDVWTREERDHASSVAQKLYAARPGEAADQAATMSVLDAGLTEQGGLAWLDLLDKLESAHVAARSTYLSLHPNSAARAEVVRAAAGEWRRRRAAPGLTLSPPLSTDR